MGNSNIGGRLNTLVLSINIIILIFVGIIATSGSNSSLRADVIERFDNKTEEVADDINDLLATTYDTTIRLADYLGSRNIDDPTELRTNILEFFNTLDPNLLIHRISLYRLDESVATLRFTNRLLDQTEYAWRIYRQPQDIPTDDPRIFDILETEAPNWFIQNSPYYDASEIGALSLATTLYAPDGALIGLLWVDIPQNLLQDELNRILSDTGLLADTLRGYDFIYNSEQIVANFNMPDVTPEIMTAAMRRFSTIANDQPQTILDPLGVGNTIVRQTPIDIVGWSFVSTLPEDEIPIVPNNIAIPIMFVAIIGLLVLVYLLARTVRNNITQPLNSLATASQEIGSGDMRYLIEHQGREDEIGRLARALDDMKSNIAHSYNELSRLNRGLEQRVQERTQEAEQARAIAIKRADELSAVYEESLIVVGESQLGRVLDALVARVQPLLDVTYCAIWLRDSATNRLQLTSTNHSQHRDSVYIIRDDEGLAGQTILANEPIILDDYTNYPHRINLEGFERGAPFVRALGIPMSFAGQSIGAIIVGRADGSPSFSVDDARILGLLANLVSPTVRNAQLFVMTQNAMQDASRANNVKTRFLASVTHELRTPLNLIINNMDFMRIGAFGDVTPEQLQRLNQTVRSSEHLLYLINDLLDVSKIDAGEMQLFMQENDIYTMLEDSVDNTYALIEKIPEKQENVQLVTEIAQELPPIEMDVRRIRQVLTNLLSNAVKFTEKGEVKLIVQPRPNGIYFSVSDQGIGIPDDQMDKLFRAFERTDQARNNNIEGTGLGLPISQYLVVQHGGKILVDSIVGKGSTFSFILPYNQKSADDSQEITRSQINAMTRSDLFGDVTKKST